MLMTPGKGRKGGGPAGEDDLRLAREAGRDRDAARRLLERLVPTVVHAVRMLIGPDPEAEDMVNLCLVTILENSRRYRAAGPLESWARGLTFRVVMRQVKRKRRYESTLLLSPVEKGFDDADPEKEAGRRNVARRIEHHLSGLPPERRATLILRVVYGHSVAETAEITGVPLNTARDRIRVALRELREAFAADPVIGELVAGMTVPGKTDGNRK